MTGQQAITEICKILAAGNDGLPVRFGAVVLRFDPDEFLLRRRQFALRTG